ncbi:MAG: ATP-binding protein [Roseburia sp.]|nr:ATP-binding protein [Roseburia sp.]MCM1099307.1 ATP-binding protein [Ruminococcus flavefaciens]
MGTYLNPGNSGFKGIRNDIYVDKSGLIGLINQTIDTPRRLTCISRPRRFGKSFAAKMLCAYYDRTCDSARLFEDLAISGDERYSDYLNRYDVIYLDMTGVIGEASSIAELVAYVKRNVSRELTESYPNLKAAEGFMSTLANAVELTGNKFIMIIDEWDAPLREAIGHPNLQREYLEFLRSLFKNSGMTDKVFAAAYMTGILPVKKDGSQSAISDFQEYSMLKPRQFGSYVGFTEEEVKRLCDDNHRDFHMMKQWYDGYELRGMDSIYNPNSVMKAIYNDDFDSYWTETSAAESLMGYISLDFDGLGRTVTELIGGMEVNVNPKGFANDLATFRDRDDVLTLLIHLGYLTYNEITGKARIPNEEIRREFARSIRQVKRDDTLRRVRESDLLIENTIRGDEEAVARQIEKIHEEESPLYYNNEQALRSVIKRAYFSYGDEYILFEELPSGSGYADIVYLPKKDSILPALVVELKWNRSAEGAIAQIRDKRYPEAIKGYGGEILLVGISYAKDAPAGKKGHQCRIERFSSEKSS